MILAFVKAEVDSPRFARCYAPAFQQWGITREQLIDGADLNDAQQNDLRRNLLSIRGYPNRTLLFAGFPGDVSWEKVLIDQNDGPLLRYANHPTWNAISRRSRRVVDGARNVTAIPTNENTHINIPAVAELYKEGKHFSELIAVRGENGVVILVEGHTRATAYILSGIQTPIEMILGNSPSMNGWAFY